MERKYILSKVKKYLFFISIAFLVVSTSHLVYKYIYNDSKQVAEKWGSISEAIIWSFPHLNPLKTTNDYNDYINHVLYRSLLSYNNDSKKIEWDITNCDISDLSDIECFLNENIVWSNWEKITYDDIETTYKILKETNINPSISSILQSIEIEKNDTSITFKTDKQDINTLNIFFQSILPKDLLDNLSEEELAWNFSPIAWVYSWKYAISKVNQDETIWVTNIILEKNKNYYSNPAYIDKITFKIFKDTSHFLKYKNSVNIFYDKKNLIWDSIPKFESYKFYLPQYISLFINSENIPYAQLRNYILMSIDNKELVKELWVENFKDINSPFIDWVELNTVKQEKFIEDMLNSLWYYKKETISQKLLPNISKDTYSNEVELSDNIDSTSYTWSYTNENYIEKSKLIYSPDWVDNYNYITKDDILLKGNVRENIDAIYINDYKLNWFNPWDTEFLYRLKVSYNTLSEWKNEYNIYFEKDWKKSLAEKLTFFYSADKQKLETYEEELIKELNQKEIEEKLAKQKQEQEELNQIKNSKWTEEYKELITKINDLDWKFYYNQNLEAFTLNLKYVYNSEDSQKTAEYVKNKIEERWIKVNISPISVDELTIELKNEQKDYDLLIAWINLGYYNFNLFPYLHSSQAKSGYNFTKIKKLSLDQILEELKSHNLSKEKILEEEEAIIKILEEEAIIKTLYTPLYSNLIDKTIEWYQLNEYIASDIYRYDPIISSFIMRKRIINSDWKNTINFFKYLFNTLF